MLQGTMCNLSGEEFLVTLYSDSGYGSALIELLITKSMKAALSSVARLRYDSRDLNEKRCTNLIHRCNHPGVGADRSAATGMSFGLMTALSICESIRRGEDVPLVYSCGETW